MSKKRVALYGRHSSDLQNPDSAKDQIALLREKLRREKPEWEVVDVALDEAVSGTMMNGRDGLKRLIRRAAECPPPFDAIVVEDVTRFARDRGDAVLARRDLAAHGVVVLSAFDNYVDPDSDAGLWTTAIQEVKAEADSRAIGQRVRRGVEARTRLGWMSGRKIPFGYRRDPAFSDTEVDFDGRPKRLGVMVEPDPLAKPVVRHMFRRYAQGWGLKRIVRELNAEDGPFRAVKPDGYAPSSLRSILLNRIYRGDLVYGRTKEKKVRENGEVWRRKIKLPPEEWTVVEGWCEPLVDEETWQAVQARFSESKGKGFGNDKIRPHGGVKKTSALSSLVRCATCGGGFNVWTSGRNSKQRKKGTGRSQRRFVCGRRLTRGPEFCGNRTTVERSVLERAVFDLIEERVLTPDGLAYLESQRRSHVERALHESEGKTDGLRREWSRIQEEEARLVKAIREGIALPGIKEEAERLARQREGVASEVERVERLDAMRGRTVDEHLRANRIQHLRDVLDVEDLDKVRLALQDLIVGVEAREDGSFWLLVGEGPLGTDNLQLLDAPQEGGLGSSHENGQEGEDAPTSSSTRRQTTGGEPRGSAPRSLERVVGATGIEPAQVAPPPSAAGLAALMASSCPGGPV